MFAVGFAVPADANWLARNQDPRGFWTIDGKPHVGLTGQCLLGFLGSGYTDRGNGKENVYAPVVRSAARFLIARQRSDGRISPSMRQHAIAALALSELHWMTRNPLVKNPARRAGLG